MSAVATDAVRDEAAMEAEPKTDAVREPTGVGDASIDAVAGAVAGGGGGAAAGAVADVVAGAMAGAVAGAASAAFSFLRRFLDASGSIGWTSADTAEADAAPSVSSTIPCGPPRMRKVVSFSVANCVRRHALCQVT